MSETISITFAGGLKVNAEYKGFEISTDQSVEEGGEGCAPEPYSLFLASLGTCAGVYILRFCQARNLPTDHIRLMQTIERSPAGKVTQITTEIIVPPDFPEKYRKPLARVADMCAVKRTLQDPPAFETRTVVSV